MLRKVPSDKLTRHFGTIFASLEEFSNDEKACFETWLSHNVILLPSRLYMVSVMRVRPWMLISDDGSQYAEALAMLLFELVKHIKHSFHSRTEEMLNAAIAVALKEKVWQHTLIAVPKYVAVVPFQHSNVLTF